MYYPSLDEFREKSRQGNLIPVYKEILADLETPVSAFLKIAEGENAFLLESVEGGEKWARYCFLGADASTIIRTKGRTITFERNGQTESWEAEGDPLDALKGLMAEYRPVPVDGLPRFYGGAVGYLSYDMVRFFERLPDQAEDDLGLPDAQFMVTDTLLVFDNISQKIKVVANVRIRGNSDEAISSAYQDGVEQIENIIDRLKQPLPDWGRFHRYHTVESQRYPIGRPATATGLPSKRPWPRPVKRSMRGNSFRSSWPRGSARGCRPIPSTYTDLSEPSTLPLTCSISNSGT